MNRLGTKCTEVLWHGAGTCNEKAVWFSVTRGLGAGGWLLMARCPLHAKHSGSGFDRVYTEVDEETYLVAQIHLA